MLLNLMGSRFDCVPHFPVKWNRYVILMICTLGSQNAYTFLGLHLCGYVVVYPIPLLNDNSIECKLTCTVQRRLSSVCRCSSSRCRAEMIEITCVTLRGRQSPSYMYIVPWLHTAQWSLYPLNHMCQLLATLSECWWYL